MRLLADENFPKSLVVAIRNQDHDVVWTRTDCAGWPDNALLDFAESESRVILTLDKDFWQLALQRRTPLRRSGIVLFRIHPATADRIKSLVDTFVRGDQGWTGHVSIVNARGIQMIKSK